jgi:hypothetical protein
VQNNFSNLSIADSIWSNNNSDRCDNNNLLPLAASGGGGNTSKLAFGFPKNDAADCYNAFCSRKNHNDLIINKNCSNSKNEVVSIP